MNFLKRLKFYLIGVGLGILMVLAIFKDRKLTSWTPANQIIKEIEEKPLVINSSMQCLLNCAGIEGTENVKSLMTQGKVNFSESDVKVQKERIYNIKIGVKNIQRINLIIYPDSIKISNVIIENLSCDCPE